MPNGTGQPDPRPGGRADEPATLSLLAEHGIALDTVTAQLLDDGLAAFDADLAKVVGTIESKLESARSTA